MVSILCAAVTLVATGTVWKCTADNECGYGSCMTSDKTAPCPLGQLHASSTCVCVPGGGLCIACASTTIPREITVRGEKVLG